MRLLVLLFAGKYLIGTLELYFQGDDSLDKNIRSSFGLICDREGAIDSEEAKILFERHNIVPVPRPVSMHANTVERHHEL